MSFLSPSRCVLILGDDGLQIYNVGALSSRFVEFVPWNTSEFEVAVRDHIVTSCKRKPVVILNNMVEQHYRKERVPKVGLMDRSAVLNRRLSVAFPSYKIRAALKLDQKQFSSAKNGKGTSYLFSAIAASDSFAKTMNAIRLAGSPVVGLYLLPIESSSMVKALSAKISKSMKSHASWTIFMGQHNGGGVRQIVTRSGELALTRMTPIVDTDVEPELWAKEISSELNATMSYLTRFGYKEADGLNVIIIANDTAEQELQNMIHLDCNLQIMNASDAAKLLNVNLGQQVDLRYADPLHAAYVGRKNKFILPMRSPTIDNVSKPRRVATALISGLLIASCVFGYMAFSKWVNINKLQDELIVSNERKASVEQQYNVELEKKKAIGFDFLMVNNSVQLNQDLEKENIQPLPILQKISQSLGTDIAIDKMALKARQEEVKSNDPYQNQYGSNEKETRVVTETVMTISFDESVDPDLGVGKVNELRDRIAQNLPNYDVKVVKQVADLSYTGNFSGESSTSSSSNEQAKEDYEAEISVKGPRK